MNEPNGENKLNRNCIVASQLVPVWRLASIFGLSALAAVLFTAATFSSKAQTTASWLLEATNSSYQVLHNPALTNLPGAYATLSRILATSAGAQTVPKVSATNTGPFGTYYRLQKNSEPPLPADLFPDLPTYELDVTKGIFVIDDRSVDYAELEAQQLADAEAKGLTNAVVAQVSQQNINTNELWLEVPENSISDSNFFNVVIHATTQGAFYDVLSKTDLLLPLWTAEETVTGAAGETPVTLLQNGRTNLFVCARDSIVPIYTQPMSQEVLAGDTVTFTVGAGGSDLFYQWTFDGTNIFGATGSTYTIYFAESTNAGDYACTITSAAGTVVSQVATLTVDTGNSDPSSMMVLGQRQNYTFREGMNYYIGSTVQLYGNTVLESGTVIKFDYTQPYPSLEVYGSLTCKGTMYDPSILTTVDDDAYGEWWSYGPPQPYVTGVPYLDLTMASNISLTNVWFRFADEAVATPAGSRLDVWDGQFFECDAAIINEFGGTDAFHNVLFAGCYEAVAASTNNFVISAEQITANVTNFCASTIAPNFMGITNSIIIGNVGITKGYSAVNTTFSPAQSNFNTNAPGNYYLTAGSALHHAGTTQVSAYLLKEFCNKTTYAPLAFPSQMAVFGNLTLNQQVPRYTNGSPDIGYYYDALDYTVAALTNLGTITIEPGTAVGFRENSNLYNQNLNSISSWGFDLREASTFLAHGMPNKQITFADVQMVDEQFALPCFGDFVPDFQGDTNYVGPTLDFRFCNFYAAPRAYHLWSGMDSSGSAMASYNSVMNWTMRDCNLHNGQICVGQPDSGGFEGTGGFFGIPYTTFYGFAAVSWNNNLFDAVQIALEPTYVWYDGTVNVNMAFQARNNLFRTHGEFVIVPVVSSTGNWTFTDNLFYQPQFYEYTTLPFDYDYNGYWPLTSTFYTGDITELEPTSPGDGTTNGLNEVVLNQSPFFTKGPFGNYYLTTITPLWEAGSQSAAAANLSQYTTFTNQVKDNANKPVNIGLHYVSATNGLPLDSDGDGVPDYVEVEHGTNPNNPMTDGVTNDAYSVIYDDIDLSGDGLVGRIKKALSLSPTNSSNPLTVTPYITGEEPDIATFRVPINYSTLTNFGSLNLKINGLDADVEDCYRAADGSCLLSWDTDYETSGQDYVQAQLVLTTPIGIDSAIVTGVGTPMSFYCSNNIQFFVSDSMYDTNGAYLDAQLPSGYAGQNVNYTIQLLDPSTSPPTSIQKITGATTNCMIQENWGGTYSGGTKAFSGNTINAVFTVNLPNGTTSSRTNTIHPLRSKELGVDYDGFDFTYMYMPTNSSLALDYGYYSDIPGNVWLAMLDPVDTLLTPSSVSGGSSNPYKSLFNKYDYQYSPVGDPGYLDGRYDVTNPTDGLFQDMTNGSTKSFYCKAHGNNYMMASSGAAPSTWITTIDMHYLLGNSFNTPHGTNDGISLKYPYRFVFLDGCSTESKTWQQVFGILPLSYAANAARQRVGPQAFVGWGTINVAWIASTSTNAAGYTGSINEVTAFARNLADDFFLQWMRGSSLASCIYNASNPTDGSAPFPVPQWAHKGFVMSGKDFYGAYNYYFPNLTLTSPIYVVGHSGLKRYLYDPTQDNLYHDPADHH